MSPSATRETQRDGNRGRENQNDCATDQTIYQIKLFVAQKATLGANSAERIGSLFVMFAAFQLHQKHLRWP